MRHIYHILLSFLVFTVAHAQIETPVKWDFKLSLVEDNTYLFEATATLEKGWYIYSQDNSKDEGPVPTSFQFKSSKAYQIPGAKDAGDKMLSIVLDESGRLIDKHDPFFNMQVKKFPDKVTFSTKIKSDKSSVRLKGELEYMACDDTKCLPPETVEIKTTYKKEAPVKAEANKATGSIEEIIQTNTINDILNPVVWEYDMINLGNDLYEMRFTAIVEKGWYIYSQNNDPDEGPQPTVFNFENASDIEVLEDKMGEEGILKSGMDPVFKVNVNKYSKHATFSRKFRTKNPNAVLQGSFEYMTCDDSKCLFPDPIEFKATVQPMQLVETKIIASDEWHANRPKWEEYVKDCGKKYSANSDKTELTTAEKEKEKEGRSIWVIFLLGMVGGFAALLTPCVFPMIPLTVSFFTKQSKTKAKGVTNALIYGLSIIVIYVLLGYMVTIIFGADALSALSTNVWFNIGFFLIFVVFAISFFGYFEITLPSWLINKSDSASDKGGLIGIFFMAFTLALVSFSCTGPIIGTLLVDAAVGGQKIGPIMGMFGFSLALALPFMLFAMFPGWLNTLPKSGGWLNSVKVVLGFIELIFALKFLSNADLVVQAGLLKRETFLIIWIIILIGLALYAFGRIKFPHDSPFKGMKPWRWIISGLSIASVIYIIPGLMCKPLSLLAGFPPPTFYSYNDCHQIHGEQDFFVGYNEAQKEATPILIDYTGWACVNCRKMEENVWPYVNEQIDSFKLISLYVDEKIELEESKKYTYYQGDIGKKVESVGNRWSDFQAHCFGANAQPYYALTTPSGELLNAPVGYTPDIETYKAWLRDGLANWEKVKGK